MKTLLTTTALVGAVAFAGAAVAGGETGGAAGGLSVTVGGFADFQGGFQSHDNDTNTSDVGFQNDTEVHIKVDGATDSGLKYGAVIEIEADVDADDRTGGTNADQTYIFVESSAGRVVLGSTGGVEATMKTGAESIARATGGIEGDFFEYVGATSTDSFVITPNLPTTHGLFTDNGATKDGGGDSAKVTYYTPRFNGFQAGVSFTPDTGNVGTSTGTFLNNDGGFENAFSVAGSYEGEFEGVGIEASVTYVGGESEIAANEDLSAWNAGLVASYEGFSIAGSYGDLGDVGVTANNDEADYWTVGGAYETGPYGLSVTYLNSEYSSTANADGDFTNLSVGADYELAPGLVPYAEVSFFEFDSTTNANDNDGNVFIVGTQLSF